MRTIIATSAFNEFYNSVEDRVRDKIDYAVTLITHMKVVSTKFVKRLEGTYFYEMRISVNNEYRVILFTIDKENFIEAEQILLLNGFMKKSTKDYKKQINIADKIIKEELL